MAAWLDTAMWRVLEVATGFKIPRGEEGDMVIRCPVDGLDKMTYQEWLVRLPVKLYGWGLRSLEETCGPSYLGALETAVPFMAARDEVCPQLADVFGGRESWGEEAPVESRWRVMLQSGCLEGQEMRRVWTRLVGQASEAAVWVGREVEEVFTGSLEGVGEGSVCGGTRGKIVGALERTKSLVLSRSLQLHRPQKARHVWAWRQKDKISSAWLLALPGPDTSLTSAEFSEAAAASLCLPSPACVGRVGEVIGGNVKVDEYGDNVQASALPGDHWRLRHDNLKFLLYRLCVWAGLRVELEVFNLFSREIPQQGLARIDSARQRQSMVPDMKITLPMEGQTRPVLHELKCISCSKSRYRPSWVARAVDKRSEALHQEYLAKARTTDQQYGGVEPGMVGPVEAKLMSFPQVQGLVFGNFGECSEATHNLLDVVATSRVRVAGAQIGRRGVMRSEAGEKAIVVSSIRRRVSVGAVKAQSSSLLGRLDSMGPGVVAAAGRRRGAMEVERRWERERRAQQISSRQSWNVLRRGFAKLD